MLKSLYEPFFFYRRSFLSTSSWASKMASKVWSSKYSYAIIISSRSRTGWCWSLATRCCALCCFLAEQCEMLLILTERVWLLFEQYIFHRQIFHLPIMELIKSGALTRLDFVLTPPLSVNCTLGPFLPSNTAWNRNIFTVYLKVKVEEIIIITRHESHDAMDISPTWWPAEFLELSITLQLENWVRLRLGDDQSLVASQPVNTWLHVLDNKHQSFVLRTSHVTLFNFSDDDDAA